MRAKFPYAGLLAAVLAAACGCVSVNRSGPARLSVLEINGVPGRPVDHIVVANFGYYLFNVVPLVSGNAKPDRLFPFSFFSDQVTLVKMHELLDREIAKTPGAEVAELGSHYEASPCFSISTDPRSVFGLLFGYREVQLSAVLVVPPEKAAPEAAEGAGGGT